MSDFQSAFSRMIAFPDFAHDVAMDAARALSPFALDERERARLCAASNRKVLSVMTLLYRGARAAPVFRYCATTCELLGEDRANDLLIEYWNLGPGPSAYYRDEVARFAAFIRGRDDVEPGAKDAAAIESTLLALEGAVLPPGMQQLGIQAHLAARPVINPACRVLWLYENPFATSVAGFHDAVDSAPPHDAPASLGRRAGTDQQTWPVLLDSSRLGADVVCSLTKSEANLVDGCNAKRSLNELCEANDVCWPDSTLAHRGALMAAR